VYDYIFPPKDDEDEGGLKAYEDDEDDEFDIEDYRL